ncbi:MAG: nucleotidyltransferase family protein [Syntrophaceae bacterium]|nr:nucleotidyltransferase family protein [Syntrophaceae bacterium]
MIYPQIEVPMDKIKDFCLKWKIKEFSLFGSVLREDFRPDSDIDVLVSFEETVSWSLYDVVKMKDELKAIFGRDVDIVEKGAVRNPFRRRSIMTNREVLYAA